MPRSIIAFPAGGHGVDETSELVRSGLLTARAESSRRSRARWHAPLKVRSWRALVAAMRNACPARLVRFAARPFTAFPR